MCALRPGLWSGIFLFLSTLLILLSLSLAWHMKKGHTLDLVLSLGLCVAISGVCDTCISNHLPVLCTVTVSSPDVSTCAPARRQHAINPLTASQFSAASEDIVLYTLDVSDLSADNLTTLFNCTCTEILDSNATSKGALQHFLRPGWMTRYCSLRRTSRQAERKWKNDKLQVSFGILHNTISISESSKNCKNWVYIPPCC